MKMEGKQPARVSGPKEVLAGYYDNKIRNVKVPPFPTRDTRVPGAVKLLPRLLCAAALAICLLSPLALKSYTPAFAGHFAEVYASAELEKPVTDGLMSVSRFLNTYLMN
jgi:hypothetical protein